MATRRGALGVRQYFLRQAALNERQTVGQECKFMVYQDLSHHLNSLSSQLLA